MTDNPIQIHDSVQAYYGAIARANDSCCGDAGCCNTDSYDASLIAELPTDVSGFSLGCGDPVTIASLKPGEHVLDLGSGGGMDCFLAAKQVGDTGYVIGVDMTPDMLAKANANKLKMNAQNVEFRKGQIEALPVRDNTIDVIMSNCVINLSPDKSAVFRESFRVLKPGGRISISDIVTEGDFSDAQRADMLQWSGCVTGAIDAGEYTALMRAAGFTDVHVIDKVDAGGGVSSDAPRVYSARITAVKPA